MKLTLKRYAVILGFALAGGVIIALLRDTFKMQGAALVGNLSDSFTIPGAILVAVGGLLWVASDGFFDMLTYGLKNGLHTLLPFYKLERKSFYDYKVEKMEKREKGIFIPFLVVGLALLAVAAILFIIYSLIK